MSVVKTRYEHIVLENGVPVIWGTTIKIIELIVQKMAYRWSPEELHFQHPDLTLGQIHSALAYYWDNAAELDEDIERRLQLVRRVEQAGGPSPLVAKLKAQGLI